MKLLVITNNPDRASFRQRIGMYLPMLADTGISSEIAELPKGFFKRRNFYKNAGGFDAVFLHKKRLNPFDALLLRRYARKVIYDFDDAVMYSGKHPERPSRKRLRDFRRTVGLADLVVAGNEYLAEHARKFNPNVEILPTGLDLDVYNVQPARNNDDKIRLVWIGSQATLPYLEEIRPALEKIGSSISNIVLRIICDEFSDLRNMEVDKCLWTPQTEIDDLVSSDIGLAPLPDNRFTRGKCGFKILQYAAAGLPSVASPVGINAEIIRDGLNGSHAETLGDWIEKISALVMNESLRIQMGQEARKMVRPFDLASIGPRLVLLVHRVIENV